MIWFSTAPAATIQLPFRLTHETMHPLVGQALNTEGQPIVSSVIFDFSTLDFVDPTGVVVLSNLIDYLRRHEIKVKFKVKQNYSTPVVYLDDFGFFRHYAGKPLRDAATPRATTVPLERLQSMDVFSYLDNKLMPWIASRVGLEQDSVAGVKTCFEEIFHNIDDHTDVKIGCVFAQFFPKNDYIQVAISDFGAGIPNVVRRLIPSLSDAGALSKAIEEGFSTKSNVRNRGAGLPTLVNYVTQRNRGTVVLVSGNAELAATFDINIGATKIRARSARGFYPGTLVKVSLRTDTFEALAADVEAEDFKW